MPKKVINYDELIEYTISLDNKDILYSELMQYIQETYKVGINTANSAINILAKKGIIQSPILSIKVIKKKRSKSK